MLDATSKVAAQRLLCKPFNAFDGDDGVTNNRLAILGDYVGRASLSFIHLSNLIEVGSETCRLLGAFGRQRAVA